jgi:DNA-binding transcriptional MocR family regulator
VTAQYQVSGATAVEISASVESGVRTGALLPGAALPPVRVLAEMLGVSAGTVAKAYQALRHRGVIETAGRNGTRVRPRPPVATSRTALRLPPPTGALDLATGGPDRRLLPVYGPHLTSVAPGVVTYESAGVLPALAEIAGSRLAADGVDPSALTVTSGALDGIERLLAAHLRPGDSVAIEDPGWANLIDLVAALGLEPVPVAVDDEGPTPAAAAAALATGARAFVVTTRAQNPTGAAVTARRAGQLRTLLRSYPQVLIVEDDHAAELSTVPLASLAGATRNWAFLRSASKPYGPDLRLAVLAGDEATVARVAGRMRVGAGWVSTLLQGLAVALWRDPDVAASVAAARDSYERRRSAVRAALADRGVASVGRTGINVWVPVADETRTVTALRDDGYAVAPGSIFRLNSAPGIRLTVSPLGDADVEPLAAAVARAVGAVGAVGGRSAGGFGA